MNIEKKLEEIRRKPAHIRERYVWVAVGICMLFVFMVWLFSLKNSLKINSEKNAPEKVLIETAE